MSQSQITSFYNLKFLRVLFFFFFFLLCFGFRLWCSCLLIGPNLIISCCFYYYF